MKTINILAGLLLLILAISCLRKPDHLSNSVIPVKTGWGYEIRYKNHVLIHQDVVPGTAGQHAFRTQDQARMAADLVLEKIREHKQPTLNNTEIQTIEAAP